MFYGSGAGKRPTASAVVADVVDEVMHQGETIRFTGERRSSRLMISTIPDAVSSYG